MPERIVLAADAVAAELVRRVFALVADTAAPLTPNPSPSRVEGGSKAETSAEPTLLPLREKVGFREAKGRMRGAAISLPSRTVIGLIGGPGSGKSTITAKLIDTLNASGIQAAAIPMDGFHMRHAKLESLGLAADKGAPHTFEAQAFADFLAEVKAATHPISGPIYTRDIEDVTENGFTIAPDTRVLIVEGNYLLLDTPPWHQVRPLLDLAVYLDIPRETVRARLLARHAEHGLFSPDHIARHVENVDLPNYDLVSATARHADLVISIQ